jgi:hypothetical protein
MRFCLCNCFFVVRPREVFTFVNHFLMPGSFWGPFSPKTKIYSLPSPSGGRVPSFCMCDGLYTYTIQWIIHCLVLSTGAFDHRLYWLPLCHATLFKQLAIVVATQIY